MFQKTVTQKLVSQKAVSQKEMFQKIVRNYLAGFRWGQIKKAYAGGGVFEFMYSLILLPIFCRLYEKWEYILIYWMVMLPVMFCRFADPMHPMTLPKMMYLCPLSEEERRSFVRGSGRLHMAVPVLMEIISLVILGVGGLMDPICALGILLGISMLSVWCCGMSRRDAKWCERYKVKFDMSTTEGIREMFGIMFGIVSVFIFAFIRCWDDRVSVRAKLIWLGITAILQIPLALGQRRVWKKTVEEAAFYEKEGNL